MYSEQQKDKVQLAAENSEEEAEEAKVKSKEKIKSLKKCCLLEGCEDIENYQRLNKIHEGNYGVVFRALQVPTGEVRAIKKLKLVEGQDFPITSIREIAIVRSLNHPNITRITRVAISRCQTKVYVVMEFIEHELKDLLTEHLFTEAQTKKLMKDLLEGLLYLHNRNIVHRDLKTSNLLYSNEGRLKICDFGLARRMNTATCILTPEVITMWYRPPELLLGKTTYGFEIDIWSVGCIFAEIVLRAPLFKANSEIEQLDAIFKVIGMPNEEAWPEFKSYRLAYTLIGKRYIGNKLREIIPKDNLSDAGVNLLSQFLMANPEKRISAKKALAHPWFNEEPRIATEDQMLKLPALNEMERCKKKVKAT